MPPVEPLPPLSEAPELVMFLAKVLGTHEYPGKHCAGDEAKCAICAYTNAALGEARTLLAERTALSGALSLGPDATTAQMVEGAQALQQRIADEIAARKVVEAERMALSERVAALTEERDLVLSEVRLRGIELKHLEGIIEQRADVRRAVTELADDYEWFGCFTGDCPHEDSRVCAEIQVKEHQSFFERLRAVLVPEKRCRECQGEHAANPMHPHIDCWCSICHPSTVLGEIIGHV